MNGAGPPAPAGSAGPLHGGANTNVMKMLISIGDLDKVVRVVRLGGFINSTPDFIAL